MKASYSLFLFVAVTAIGASGADALPMNGGFEASTGGKAEFWRTSCGDWSVRPGAGVGGSAAMVWEASEPIVARAVCEQVVPLQAGRRYAIRAMISTSGYEGRGACIEYTFLHESHEPLTGCYPRGRLADRNCAWSRVEGLARAPKNAVAAVIRLVVPEGSKGSVAFDDVVFEEVEMPVVSYAFTSAYRDTVAEGPFRFHAFLNLPDKLGASEVAAFFIYRDGQGLECRGRAVVGEGAGGTFATLDADAADLALGEQDVRCEVVRRDGRTLGSRSFPVVRVTELPKRRVAIDRVGRCLVDGKPFFPLGMYGSASFGEREAAVYATGPFNVIQAYGLSTREGVEAFARHGIRYIATLKNELAGNVYAVRRGLRTQADVESFFRSEVEKLKDCPNFLAWYICDEAPKTEIPARQRLYRLYRELDPEHPCWAVMDMEDELRNWLSICDICGVDPYPIPGRPMTVISDFCKLESDSFLRARPFWNVPQNFCWKWFDGIIDARPGWKKPDVEFPTDGELHFMNWLHIAGGANGLIGYSFMELVDPKYAPAEDFPRLWKGVCDAYAEVERFTDVLLSDPYEAISGAADGVPVRAWTRDGALYVLACNARANETEASIRLGEGAWRFDRMELGGRESVRMDAAGRTLMFRLPTKGVFFCRLKACESCSEQGVNK